MSHEKPDLRDGKPGGTGTTEAQVAGHKDKMMPLTPSGENAVNPMPGSKAGMAEGQVTKSN